MAVTGLVDDQWTDFKKKLETEYLVYYTAWVKNNGWADKVHISPIPLGFSTFYTGFRLWSDPYRDP